MRKIPRYRIRVTRLSICVTRLSICVTRLSICVTLWQSCRGAAPETQPFEATAGSGADCPLKRAGIVRRRMWHETSIPFLGEARVLSFLHLEASTTAETQSPAGIERPTEPKLMKKLTDEK